MSKKILILGKGYIGNRLLESMPAEITADRVNSLADALGLIEKYNPEVIINCVGFTGERNVDDCELKPEKTLQANTIVPLLLAEACLRKNVKLVHISSGCIYHFDYNKPTPISEKKEPDYFDLYYSRSKIYSEQALETLSRQYNILILRIRLPLDNRPASKNVLTKVLKFTKIIDTPNSITYIPDFIYALKYLIKTDARGLFNVTNKGTLTYPDILKIYRRYRPEFQYEVMSHKGLTIKRTNLIMTSRKLEQAGFKMRSVRDILEECVKEYVSRL